MYWNGELGGPEDHARESAIRRVRLRGYEEEATASITTVQLQLQPLDYYFDSSPPMFQVIQFTRAGISSQLAFFMGVRHICYFRLVGLGLVFCFPSGQQWACFTGVPPFVLRPAKSVQIFVSFGL